MAGPKEPSLVRSVPQQQPRPYRAGLFWDVLMASLSSVQQALQPVDACGQVIRTITRENAGADTCLVRMELGIAFQTYCGSRIEAAVVFL